VRRLAFVVLCALVGLAAGAIWTLLQSDRYRAEARVLVRPETSGVVPAVETLAESSLVESNIAQTLHLASSPNVSAKSGKGGVLTVSVEEGSRERARQVDAEAVVILTQKVSERFGAAGVTATVLDPAHVAEQTSPTPGRNLLITGLAGLLVGVAISTALSPRARPRPQADPELERRLHARIDGVATRERMLAERAGQLAAREHDLDRRDEEEAAAGRHRDEEFAEKQRELERREAELEAREAEPEPEPEPEPEAVAEPPPEPEPVQAVRTGWNLRTLEHLVAAQTDAHPREREEWEAYLFYLREHADHDGKLPATFNAVVAVVFGDLTGAFSPSDEL
jgi:capsular polysaccharide biosynthesis protein